MTGLLIGYARVSTNDQDLTAQKNALVALGVSSEKTFTDQGLTGANRARPGLREALAACRAGDTLVVTKIDRLARRCAMQRTSLTNSPAAKSSSASAAPSTTRPIP